MGIITDRLTELSIVASSPDGRIEGRLDGGRRIGLRIMPEDFDDYRVVELERQLTALVTTLWRKFDHARTGIMAAAGIHPPDTGPHWKREVRELQVLRANALYEGRSGDEFVVIASEGWKRFTVNLAPEAVVELSVDEFIDEFSDAVADLMADFRMATADMKREVYGWATQGER